MDRAPEYAIGVKAWPAYVLVTLLVVAVPLYGVMVALLLGADSMSWAGYLVAVVIVGRGLFVYVHEPEAYADGDPTRLRRIRRAMRQFYGTPFVYPLRRGAAELRDADQAILHFSQGRHRVTAETHHG